MKTSRPIIIWVFYCLIILNSFILSFISGYIIFNVLFYFKNLQDETVQEEDIGGDCSSLYKSEHKGTGELYL